VEDMTTFLAYLFLGHDVEWSLGDRKKLFLCSKSSIWSLNLKLVVHCLAGMLVFLVLYILKTMALYIRAA